MTNSTRLIGLIMATALWAGGAAAQGVPSSDWSDDAPPEMVLPSANDAVLPPVSGDPDSASMMGQPDPFVDDGSTCGPIESFQPEVQGLWTHAAPIESTGTWLRRGFWYAEADAVVWNRMWNRDDQLYASGDFQVNIPTFFDPRFSSGIQTSNRQLIVQGANPGQDASVRTTLGHFLFRDAKNRDHTVEFTAFGSGKWEQNRVLSSEAPFGLFVPFLIDGGNRTWDNNSTVAATAVGSSRQTLDYQSNFNSFETNYRVRQRLSRDQLVMDANGQWHRSANSGFEREYLAGLRFLEMKDSFNWQAEDIEVEGADGSYIIDTDNNLFGFQLGTGLTFQASRWSLGFACKGGVFVNDASGHTVLNFTADDNDDANLIFKEDELSFVGETRLQARYHVTPNVSLRAAYELMYIESVALAPNQATFITDFSYLNTSGDPFYHGASFGIEGYW